MTKHKAFDMCATINCRGYGIWGSSDHCHSCGVCSDKPRFLPFLLRPEGQLQAWIYIRTQQLNHHFDYSKSKILIHILYQDASTNLQTCLKAFERKRSLCNHRKAAHDHTGVVRLEGPTERQQLAHGGGAGYFRDGRIVLSGANAPKGAWYVESNLRLELADVVQQMHTGMRTLTGKSLRRWAS